MAFPSGTPVVTLTGTLPSAVAGSGYGGQVVLTPSAILTDQARHAVYPGGGKTDITNGTFSVQVIPNDAAGILPAGWRWYVDVQPTRGKRVAFWADIHGADGTTIHLDELVPAQAPGGGTTGVPGKSAYELAVEQGYTGTVTQWLASLVGPAGAPGSPGAPGAPGAPGTPGSPGADGQDGASAYELAVAAGFAGTQSQWLASLVGAKGDKGDKGDTGPQPPLGAAGAGPTIALKSDDPTTTNSRPPTAHASSHAEGGSDPLTLAQDQITGLLAALAALLPTAGGTLTGDLIVEGYTTLAGGQANNSFSAFGALSALAGDASPVHRLDATTGVAALGAKNGLANIRFCGLRGTTGAPATGTWAVGDTVLDSAGALWLCTTAGTPGTWASAAGSGGGGSTIRTTDVRLSPGNVALASAGSWTVVTSSGTRLAASITAAVGDRIQASPSFMRTGSGCFLDLTILDSAGAISRYFGTDSATPLSEGHPSYYPQASSFPGVPGTMQIVVGSGEVDGTGKATIALAYKGSGGETIYADSTYPWYMLLTNLGPEPA